MGDANLKFGAEASDRDGTVGQFTRIFIDPTNYIASHIVVVPDDVSVTARLVPIERAGSDSSSRLLLMCSRAEFLSFDDAVEYETLPYSPVADALLTVLTENQRSGGMGLGGPAVASSDRIPEGKIGLSREQAVLALDGHFGVTTGVVVDLSGQRVMKLVVAEGHLWSKKLVTLPIESVKAFGDEIRLTISTKQAQALAD